MVDLSDKGVTSQNIGFYSDASASKEMGFGTIMGNKWVQAMWNEGYPNFIKECQPSIEFLELYALCAGVFTWEADDALVNGRVILFCDNMAVVHMINEMTSGCQNCMYLIRLLVLNCLKFNRRLSAHYIKSRKNCLSDALSRNQMERFRKVGPHMNQEPDKLSETIWPLSKVWR